MSILIVHCVLFIASRAGKHKIDNAVFKISVANAELSGEREQFKFSCCFLVANSAIHEMQPMCLESRMSPLEEFSILC